MQAKWDPIPWHLQILLGFQSQGQGHQSRPISEGLNSRGLKWVFLILVMVLHPPLNCGEYWRLEEERDLPTSLRGPPGTLGLHLGSLHIVWDNFLPSYTVHVSLNGDLSVSRGTNSNYISVSAFWREKTMLYKVAPGESGAIAISFPPHLSTLSLAFGSLLTRPRACLILCPSLYPLPLWLTLRCRRDAFLVLVHGLWFHFIMNSGWARDWRCRHRALTALTWKGSWECLKSPSIRGQITHTRSVAQGFWSCHFDSRGTTMPAGRMMASNARADLEIYLLISWVKTLQLESHLFREKQWSLTVARIEHASGIKIHDYFFICCVLK